MKNGYSICFNEWALDKDIKNELGLLLIISSLCAEKGYCFASNSYLANLFNITEVSVSMKLKKLEKKDYIKIDYKFRGCEVISREIRLKKFLIDDLKKIKSTVKENFKDNNTSINNTSINIKENIKRKVFQKPTLEEVQEYCIERNNNIDASNFIDFYESKDWYVGKNKMKDWKACIRTWERRNNNYIESKPEWFNKNIEMQKATEEEQKEIEEMLKNYK